MGQNTPHMLGREKVAFFTSESTPGTFVKPTAGAAMKVLSSKVSKKIMRLDRDDNRATRGVVSRTTGKAEGTWSVESYVNPNAPGTAPDIGELLKAALGTETVNAGVSVVYGLTSTQGTQKGASFVHGTSLLWSEAAVFALINTLKITVSGGDRPKISAEGPCASVIQTAYTTLQGAASSATTINATDHAALDVGSVVKVGTDDNSSAGYDVTALAFIDTITVVNYANGASDTITLTRTDEHGVTTTYTLTEGVDFNAATDNNTTATNIKNAIDALEFFEASVVSAVVTVTADANTNAYASASGDATAWTVAARRRATFSGASITQSNGAAVAPFLPSETTGGAAISGIAGTITLDGVTLDITSFEISVTNNWNALADSAFQQVYQDAIEGEREIKGSITVRARRDFMDDFKKRNAFQSLALSVRCGPSTSRKMTISVPRAELEFGDVEIPQNEVATFSIPFMALESSASSNDALTITFA